MSYEHPSTRQPALHTSDKHQVPSHQHPVLCTGNWSLGAGNESGTLSPWTANLTEIEQEGFHNFINGSLTSDLLAKLMQGCQKDGKPLLTSQVFDSLQQYYCMHQEAKTPFAQLLIQHILVCHCRCLLLQLQAGWSANIKIQERYLNLATRELNKLRRLMLTYQELNSPRPVTVVRAEQANISQGPQQIVNHPHHGRIKDEGTNLKEPTDA